MLRAQHDVNAADAEVATLQKSVDYWKEVRTALGGKDVLMDKQGNPITADGKLVVEEINSIDDISDDDFNVPTRNIQLPILPLHIDKAIGANGKPVVIKKNIFNKNRKNHKDLGASDSRYILNNVFYNTNMYGQNQKVSRPYNWILIHTADKNSAVIVEVNEGKDNVEVVGWQYLRGNSLEQKKRQAIKEGGLILTLENAAGNTLNGSSSASKDNVGLSDMQEKVEETVEQDNKVSDNTLSQKIASAESEVNTTPSEGQKKAGNYKKGHVQIGSSNVTIEQLKGSGWAEHDRFYLEMVLRGFQKSYILLLMTFL